MTVNETATATANVTGTGTKPWSLLEPLPNPLVASDVLANSPTITISRHPFDQTWVRAPLLLIPRGLLLSPTTEFPALLLVNKEEVVPRSPPLRGNGFLARR